MNEENLKRIENTSHQWSCMSLPIINQNDDLFPDTFFVNYPHGRFFSVFFHKTPFVAARTPFVPLHR